MFLNYGLHPTLTDIYSGHFMKLDIQIPPEVRCFACVLCLQISAQGGVWMSKDIYIYGYASINGSGTFRGDPHVWNGHFRKTSVPHVWNGVN